jgi:hypothetical protein
MASIGPHGDFNEDRRVIPIRRQARTFMKRVSAGEAFATLPPETFNRGLTRAL